MPRRRRFARCNRTVVADEADDVPAQAAERRDRVARSLRLELEVVAVIADLLKDDAHVDRRIEGGWRVERLAEEGVDFARRPVDWVRGFLIRSESMVVSGQVAQQAPRGSEGANLVAHGEVRDPALPVNARAAELVGGHIFPEHRLDHTGTGQPEKGVVGLNHEAALPWKVRPAARVVPEHAHDARNHPADFAERREGLGVSVQTADARRHERTCAVVHPDQRHPLTAGQADDVGKLGAVGRVHRAGTHREIMAIDSDLPTADLDDGRHDRRAIEIRPPVLVQDGRLGS